MTGSFGTKAAGHGLLLSTHTTLGTDHDSRRDSPIWSGGMLESRECLVYE